MNRTYHNPVMPGFHPDPSIVRVGDDFYAVNSTFHYFPGVIISHSNDLVHWRAIGHALSRSDFLDMRELMDSRGFWAPDISYHNGLFYIFVTLRLNEVKPDGTDAALVRRQAVFTARDPAGPWSRPRFIDVNGIDPSHFVDDDGRHYMLLNPGVTLVPLDDECTKAIGDPVRIWDGSGGRIPEGPHLLKKDGWYHLFTAEGGTGYAHQIGSGRSRNIMGPYEANPYSPLLLQRDPEATLQRTGHGKPVMTADGHWWILYLCGRPFTVLNTSRDETRFCVLGRETSLEPLSWTDDGWPLVNGGNGPSLSNVAPDLPWTPVPDRECDDFDGENLGLEWYTPRNPDYAAFSLVARPGFLRLYCRNADLDQMNARPVVRRETSFRSVAECRMDFAPASCGEEAGMTLYYDTKTHIKFSRVATGVGTAIRISENRGEGPVVAGETAETAVRSSGPVCLRIVTDGLTRSFAYSYDGREWIDLLSIPDAWYLSDEGYSGGRQKRFTGCMVGLFACNGGNAATTPADFDWFTYRKL